MIKTLREHSSTLVLVVLLACLLYAGMLFWATSARAVEHLTGLSLSAVAVVVLLVSAGYLLRFLRWHIYVKQLGYTVPVRANLRIFLASFLMSISPGKVGEAVKSYFLREEFDVPVTPTLAGFFCERFTDVLSMILLASSGFLIYPRGALVMVLILILQLGVLVALQFESIIEQWVFTPLENLPLFENIVEKFRGFYNDSGTLLSFKNLSIGTLLGFLSWGLEGLCLGIILRELGMFSISYPSSVFIFCAAVLLGAAAMLPGGLGSSEAIMVTMLLFFGAERAVAVSATILVRFMTLWYGVGLGLVAWLLCWRALRFPGDSAEAA
ncbi:MAG: YbhN family protein [bacterium]